MPRCRHARDMHRLSPRGPLATTAARAVAMRPTVARLPIRPKRRRGPTRLRHAAVSIVEAGLMGPHAGACVRRRRGVISGRAIAWRVSVASMCVRRPLLPRPPRRRRPPCAPTAARVRMMSTSCVGVSRSTACTKVTSTWRVSRVLRAHCAGRTGCQRTVPWSDKLLDTDANSGSARRGVPQVCP